MNITRQNASTSNISQNQKLELTKTPSGGILPITEYGNAITILDTLIESQEYWMDTSLNITRYNNISLYHLH